MLVSRLWLTLLAVALLAGPGPAAGAQWHYLSGGAFNGISSVGDRVWVVGQDGLFFQSYDNGANWFRVPRFTALDLLDVEFWNENNGLLLGTDRRVFRTTNAGANWDSVYLPTDSRYLKFVSRDVVWATGGTDDPSVSVDGGLTWQRRTGGPRASFIDSLNGWQAAYFGAPRRFIDVMKTTNGGRGWVLAGQIDTEVGGETYVRLIHFSSAMRGICAWYTFFSRSSSRANIHVTSDGGETWHGLGLSGAYHADHTADELVLALHQSGCSRVSGTAANYVEFGLDEKLNDVSASRGNNLWVCGNGGSIFSSSDSGRRWQKVSLSAGNLVRRVAFFDTAVGFSMGERAVYRTTDAGRTWTATLKSYVRKGRGFVGFALPAPDRALVSYDDILYDGYLDEARGNIRLYLTENAGRTWSATHSRYLVTRGYAPWAQGLAFSDSIHGWHPGFAPGENSVRTTDGGATWRESSSIGSRLLYELKPSFPVVDTGWLAEGRLWRTTDGGESWDDLGSGATCILMRDTRSGWKVASSLLWRTVDGGVNWSGVPGSEGVLCVTFVSGAHGACVGTGGLVLRTSDGGETWVRDSTGFTSDLTTVFMLDSARVWVAGKNGLVLGHGEWAMGRSESAPAFRSAQPHRLTVRPNPCRDRVVVEIGRVSGLELELRDVAGRRVRRLAVQAGSRSVSVDLRGLPAGVYFVTQPRAAGEAPVRLVKVE